LPVTLKTTQKQGLEHPEASQGWSSTKFPWKQAAFWALLVFAIFNMALWRLEGKKSTDVWHGTGSIDLAVGQFKQLNARPTVVLLGSSLMMYPFWSMDLALDPKHVGDIFHHHGSLALEEDLRKAGFANPHVFSLAIFGQMVSDAFIYVNEFLRKDKAPEFLVYGVAPRDFSDHDLSSPMSTNTFQRLVNLDNLAPYANLYLPGFQDKVEFMMSRICYLYNHRSRIQQEFGKAVQKGYIAGHIQAPVQEKIDSSNAGFLMFGGFTARWENSRKEYERRYKNIGEQDLSLQMGFLKRLLEVAHERGIKVVLVNMPLSDMNRNLLPPGFYKQFRDELKSLANRPDVRFLDIGDSPDFNRMDFWDTAHLGPPGGRKILTHLMPVLSEMHKENASSN
jgi:hypothetical protein